MSAVAELPRRVQRLLAELAPAVCPPDIKELGLIDAVIDHVGLTLASLSSDLRTAILVSMRVLSVSARLHRQAPADRFARWWSARGRPFRTAARVIKALYALAYYEQRPVKDRMGYRPEEWIAGVSRRRLEMYSDNISSHETALLAPDPLVPPADPNADRPLGPKQTATAESPPDRPAGTVSTAADRTASNGRPLELSCDVVVIGSGAGGGVVAAELAEAGLDVLVLEEGGHHTTDEFTADSTAMVRMLYRDGGLEFARGRPPVQFAEGRCVGGSTVVNGGMSWRTPERVLDRWARDEGVERIRPGDMERHFERVERRISVAPQDPGSIGRDNELLREGAERLGWRVVRDLRAQVHCGGCNTCTYGCPTGAKQSVLVSYLPRAVRFGARVQADCRVDRVVFEGCRAVGVEAYLTDARRPVRVRAENTFVCGGAIQTPALLFRSGFRSPSGRVGRNLSLHPNAFVTAIFDEDVHGFHGAHQGYQVREFEDEGIIMAAVNLPPGVLASSVPRFGAGLAEVMRDYHRIVTAGVLVEDTSVGRVRVRRGRPVTTYPLNDRDAATIVRGLGQLAELLFAAGARRMLLPFEGVPAPLGPDEVSAALARPVPKASMQLFTVHVMGTAAMGGDVARHVCDSYGRVHGAEALYVADASLFPTPVGVNPMETIMALATRNAERFLESRAE